MVVLWKSVVFWGEGEWLISLDVIQTFLKIQYLGDHFPHSLLQLLWFYCFHQCIFCLPEIFQKFWLTERTISYFHHFYFNDFFFFPTPFPPLLPLSSIYWQCNIGTPFMDSELKPWLHQIPALWFDTSLLIFRASICSFVEWKLVRLKWYTCRKVFGT